VLLGGMPQGSTYHTNQWHKQTETEAPTFCATLVHLLVNNNFSQMAKINDCKLLWAWAWAWQILIE